MKVETSRPLTPRPNALGLRGWLYAGRYSFERYLYSLHRLTGLGLILYLLIHIIETGQRLNGVAAWTQLMALFHSPVFKLVEYLLFAAFIYHGLNGFRLLLTELGFFMGRPTDPVYPYRSSVKQHRPLTYALMGLAALVLILGGASLFFS